MESSTDAKVATFPFSASGLSDVLDVINMAHTTWKQVSRVTRAALHL